MRLQNRCCCSSVGSSRLRPALASGISMGIVRLSFLLSSVIIGPVRINARPQGRFAQGLSIRGFQSPLMNFQNVVEVATVPVVLIPGTGGNQLEVKLNSDYKAGSLWCNSLKKGYFRLWLDVLALLPPFTTCFAERMKLNYNAEKDQFENPPGIDTRVPYFGTTEGMEYLDPNFKSVTAYMALLVKALKSKGYVVGKSLFGAPYDFRFAPGPQAAPEATAYLENLKRLIELAYERNGDERVVLVSHSLGSLWVLYFLNRESLAWRNKYISHFLAISAPWGGSVQEMLTFASGSSQNIPILNPLIFRDEQRHSESNFWLLPVPKIFKDQTLVITPFRNYSALNLKEFLTDIGYEKGIVPYSSRVPVLTDTLTAPQVPVTIIYGHGVGTPERFVYFREGFDYQPNVVEGNGDGTVNLCSLTAVVESWENVDGQKLSVVGIPGKTHTTILTDVDSVEIIVGEILRTTLGIKC